MPVKCYLPKKGQFQSDMVVEFNYEDRDDPNHNHIKEYDKAPIVFKTFTKGKDIKLPLGAIVRAYVSVKQPQQNIKLDSFETNKGKTKGPVFHLIQSYNYFHLLKNYTYIYFVYIVFQII